MQRLKILRLNLCSIIIALFLLLPSLALQAGESRKGIGVKEQIIESGVTPYIWYNRGKKETVWMSEDEVAVFLKGRAKASRERKEALAQILNGSLLPKSNDFIMFVRIRHMKSEYAVKERAYSLKQYPEVKEISPVFYKGKRQPSNRMSLTGEIIIHFYPEWDETMVKVFAKRYNLTHLKKFDFSQNAHLFLASSALESIKIANEIQMSGEVIYAYPNWFKSRVKRAIPNDTLFSNQWHLLNTGQGGGMPEEDVNIVSVWDTYEGDNQVIAIVDDGIETGHEDLAGNILTGYHYDWIDGDTDPNPFYPDDNHGTAVAGVAAAMGFNGLGVTGAAPLALLVGYRLPVDGSTDHQEAEAMVHNKDIVDISNNSWGPPDDVRLEAPGPLMEDALKNGVTWGRDGRGIIYVWSGGNGGDENDNSNYDGYANSRYTIAVAASTNFGTHALYSEEGANIFVNAPSSGGSSDITTTDRTGSDGYSNFNYDSTFGGTSAAAPLVSGIIALMLEANPNLTWRDVQHILISTARNNDPEDIDWTINGAGYHINHKYGFGRIDANAAVEAARVWVNVNQEVLTEESANPNLSIPDNNLAGVSSSITINDDINIEYVEVLFSADHTYWGDLEIVLTSPSGTRSILAENVYPAADKYNGYDNWRFGSVRHFNESSRGTWTLAVKDLSEGDTGTFQSWSLRIYGTLITSPDISIVETINLLNPPNGQGFTVCSLYDLPTFRWETSGTFKGIELQFSKDNFSTVSVRVKGKKGVNELKFTSAIWKKILSLIGVNGRTINWRVVGTMADKTKAYSNTFSFVVEGPEAIGNPWISPTSETFRPTLSWQSNCNIKFKVWFGNEPDFSKTGVKKKAFVFSIKNPNKNGAVFTKQLKAGAWAAIRRLVWDVMGSTIYWYVESRDGLKRYSMTEVKSFQLER